MKYRMFSTELRHAQVMRQLVMVTLLIGACIVSGSNAPLTSGWKLDWSDEFDRFGNPEVSGLWSYDCNNRDLPNYSYTDKNYVTRGAFCDSGYDTSVLTDLDNDGNIPVNDAGPHGWCQNGYLILQGTRVGTSEQYISTGISSFPYKGWKYGRFEMRGRIDIRQGSWPAWWTVGHEPGVAQPQRQWPRCGELDLMEYYTDRSMCNVCDGAGRWDTNIRKPSEMGGRRWAAEFHTWVVEWDSLWLDMSVDTDYQVAHYDVDNANGTGVNGVNPFRQSHYMLLNQAIGSTGGDPSNTQFPIRYETDYVRHWSMVSGTACLLTVENGTGSGPYIVGTLASITAQRLEDVTDQSKVFDKWVVTAGSAKIDNEFSPNALLIMPDGDVTVAPTYKTIADTNKLLPPLVFPNGGSFTDSVRVTFDCPAAARVGVSYETAFPRIYYTLDGSAPDSSKTPFTGVPILLKTTTTIKVIAYMTGRIKSDIVTAEFTKENVSALPLQVTGKGWVSLRLNNKRYAPATTMFALNAKANRFSVIVFNVLGRELYRSSGSANGGNITISWDGRTRSGALVNRGIYFVQCRAGDMTETQKLIIR